MTTRKKISLTKPEIETQEELRATVGKVAEDILAERELKNAMDSELQGVRLKYETDLADLAQDIDQATELCASYCTQHPDLFPRDHKSLDLTHAIIGFRTGTPKVKVLKRWTVAAVIDALRARKWLHFLRQPDVELDKTAIIAQRAEYPDDVLKTVGLEVVQDETFYIDPKLEAHPAGVKMEAA